MLVLCNAVAADIVAVLTQLVKIICRLFGTFRIQRPELPHDLGRPRRDAAHELRIKQIVLRNRVMDLPVSNCIVAQNIQAFRELVVFLLLFITLEFQFRQKRISCKYLIQRVQQLTVLRIIEQRIDCCPHGFNLHSHADAPCASSRQNR